MEHHGSSGINQQLDWRVGGLTRIKVREEGWEPCAALGASSQCAFPPQSVTISILPSDPHFQRDYADVSFINLLRVAFGLFPRPVLSSLGTQDHNETGGIRTRSKIRTLASPSAVCELLRDRRIIDWPDRKPPENHMSWPLAIRPSQHQYVLSPLLLTASLIFPLGNQCSYTLTFSDLQLGLTPWLQRLHIKLRSAWWAYSSSPSNNSVRMNIHLPSFQWEHVGDQWA